MPKRNEEKTVFDLEKTYLTRLKPFEFKCLSSHVLIWFYLFKSGQNLESIGTCQIKVSAHQYHVTILQAQV